jgi:hypothetical protein
MRAGEVLRRMDEERYPGERRGLRLFLEGLVDAVDAELGRDALLFHRIKIALERGDLAALRAARQMFNHQDTALKRRLSLARQDRRARGLVAPTAAQAVASTDDSEPRRGAAVLTLPTPTRNEPAE